MSRMSLPLVSCAMFLAVLKATETVQADVLQGSEWKPVAIEQAGLSR